MIKAFFSSVASRNENDYLTLCRLNYLFITVYHLLSLSPHLWPLDFSQWLYKFLFHLKASEHLFSSWVDLSIFFHPLIDGVLPCILFPHNFFNVCTSLYEKFKSRIPTLVIKFSTILFSGERVIDRVENLSL